MKNISLGYSPCPNDTFIFYAMIHGKVDTGDLRFNEVLLDVETLNQRALNAELDMTKISYHAFGYLRDHYRLLTSGSALGRGCGPLLVAKHEYSMDELRGKKIAIPGRLTTAFLLLQLYNSSFTFDYKKPAHLSPDSNLLTPDPVFIEMPFHEIVNAVSTGKVDAGLIIHESRFTYPSYGLKEIIDLGKWWEKHTGLPIPLGGIIVKRTLAEDLAKQINTILKQSIQYAFANRTEPMNYIKKHSQELSEDVIKQHIDLYVNDFSIDMGREGEQAVEELISRAEEAGIIPRSTQTMFIPGHSK